jgi:hypothetical protein
VRSSTKSGRAEADFSAPMGRGATATMERLAASLGQLGEAAPRLASALDIPKGGVLLALPALLVSGLLRHSAKSFHLPAGFYGLTSIFLLLAMPLGRFRSIEALRYYATGKWGKLLALDNAPEVRTLASSSSSWLTRNKRFPGAQQCARTGCWKPPKR